MGFHKGSPQASLVKRSVTLQHLFDLDSKSACRSAFSGNNYLDGARQTDMEYEEILSLISYCSNTYTFTDPSESPYEHDLKQQNLRKLFSIIRSLKKPFPDQILSPLFAMLSTNLLRPLPPANNAVICILPDDDDLLSSPLAAWPHLHIVYDILLRLIINLDANVLQDYIDHSFILNLLTLFQSEDHRERESLKNVFHCLYSKLTFYRSFMRKAANDVLLHYVFEMDQPHYGIGDLLEICGSIINGFSIPLKDEHKLFLTRVLIPLHRPKGMQAYHKQLAYCVYQFIQKEPSLAEVVVRGILRYWPVTNCQKEVLLIGELEELVEYMGLEQYRALALPLCTQITKCLNSWNSQVAERALYVWNNEQFVNMALQAMEDVFPVIVEGMEKNLRWHWSRSVKQLTENVKNILEELEPGLYSKCLLQLDQHDSAINEEEIRRKKRWEKVEMAAKRNQYIQEQQCICVSNLGIT